MNSLDSISISHLRGCIYVSVVRNWVGGCSGMRELYQAGKILARDVKLQDLG